MGTISQNFLLNKGELIDTFCLTYNKQLTKVKIN